MARSFAPIRPAAVTRHRLDYGARHRRGDPAPVVILVVSRDIMIAAPWILSWLQIAGSSLIAASKLNTVAQTCATVVLAAPGWAGRSAGDGVALAVAVLTRRFASMSREGASHERDRTDERD
jgi:hypothetical protein